MDKLIRVPKSNKAEEPLLDIEERRHNYDDRRTYTSYDEITKDFEDDFRCQDDNEEDNNSEGISSALSTACTIYDGLDRENTPSIEKKGLLIDNGNENSCRQRKLPILPSQHSGSISHANAASQQFPSSPCATTLRDTRFATRPAAFRTVTATAGVGGNEGTGASEAARTDNLGAKSSKTLQESIRESLTINNATQWNQDKLGSNGTNHLIFEMNEFYIDMMDRLNEMRKHFGYKKVLQNSIETDPKIRVDFEEWILANDFLNDEIVKPETTGTCKYDREIIKEFENIVRLDKEIEMVDLLRKKIKDERLEIQKNLCEETEDFEKSQIFLELCASEVNSEEKPLVENNDVNVAKKKSKCKSAIVGKNFITRNMELAKNMSFPVSLTDEEKIKLDAMLSEEIDDEDSCEKDEKHEEIDSAESEDDLNESQSKKSKNEYQLVDEDWERMSEINERIKNLSTVEENIFDINDVECQLEDDVKLGKNWKYSLLNERLKEIDDQLFKITLAREEENEDSAVNELITDINQSDNLLEVIEGAV